MFWFSFWLPYPSFLGFVSITIFPFWQGLFACHGVWTATCSCKHSWGSPPSEHMLTLAVGGRFSCGVSSVCIIPQIVFNHKLNIVHFLSKRFSQLYFSLHDLTTCKFLVLQYYYNSINEHSEFFWLKKKLLEIKSCP